jgi:hypothetical protein
MLKVLFLLIISTVYTFFRLAFQQVFTSGWLIVIFFFDFFDFIYFILFIHFIYLFFINYVCHFLYFVRLVTV